MERYLANLAGYFVFTRYLLISWFAPIKIIKTMKQKLILTESQYNRIFNSKKKIGYNRKPI